MAQSKKKHHEEEKRETAGGMRWLVSYADLLTLLFALFVILYAIKQDNPSKIIEMARGLRIALGSENPPSPTTGRGESSMLQEVASIPVRSWYKEVTSILRDPLSPFDSKITYNSEGVLVSFSGNIFFGDCSAEILPDGRRALKALAGVLSTPDLLYHRVEIWGHADGLSPGESCRNTYPRGNIELAAQRAISVDAFFAQATVPRLDPTRFRIQSHGARSFIGRGFDSDFKRDPDRRGMNRQVEIFVEQQPYFSPAGTSGGSAE